MKIITKLTVIIVAASFLTACMSGPLKAPCNEYATFCGHKIKINNW